MKRAFIRGLWGTPEGDDRHFGGRRRKMDSDIELVLGNKHKVPFVTYTCGKDNHEYLLSKGIESKLVCEEPFLYPAKENGWHQYGHKLYILEDAMEDYDEIIFLDFDTICVKPLPDKFWESFYEKSSIQAAIRGYKLKKIWWRENDRRKRPCASLIYLREKGIAREMVKLWEQYPTRAEEDIIALQIDEMTDGWKGMDYYWENFEPTCFDLLGEAYRIWPEENIKKKNLYFRHVNKQRKRRILRKRNGRQRTS